MDVDEVGTGQPVIEKHWKPEPKQNDVIAVPDTVFELLGGGAAGGGKTDLGLLIPSLRQFTEHPKFKGLVLRRTLHLEAYTTHVVVVRFLSLGLHKYDVELNL